MPNYKAIENPRTIDYDLVILSLSISEERISRVDLVGLDYLQIPLEKIKQDFLPASQRWLFGLL